MPRANRDFLTGYIWHITQSAEASSNRSTCSRCSKRMAKESIQEFTVRALPYFSANAE